MNDYVASKEKPRSFRRKKVLLMIFDIKSALLPGRRGSVVEH